MKWLKFLFIATVVFMLLTFASPITGLANSLAAFSTPVSVDPQENAGSWNAIAVDLNNHLHISYQRTDPYDLMKYAYHNGTEWIVETVDARGSATDIITDANNFPHISYCDDLANVVKYAYKDAGGWHNQIVDNTIHDCGSVTQIILDSNGHPYIGYQAPVSNPEHNVLRYAFLNDGSWQVRVVDANGNVGLSPSLDLDSNDQPHFAYYDATNNVIKYAYYSGSSWQYNTIGPYESPSLRLDKNDRPYISFVSGTEIGYGFYDGGVWHKEFIQTGNRIGRTSLDLDQDGHPHVALHNRTQERLMYIYDDGVSWIGPIDICDVGPYVPNLNSSISMSLDSIDQPHISFNNALQQKLFYVSGLVPQNNPPIAIDTGPFEVQEGEEIEIAASGSDPDNDPIQFAWDLDRNGSFETLGQTTTFSAIGLDGPSVIYIPVRVSDPSGGFDITEVEVEITNVAPVISLEGFSTSNEGSIYELLLGAVIDPGIDDITSITVHWGDNITGEYSTSGIASHAYMDGLRTYTISVDLEDEDGVYFGVVQKSVTVNDVDPRIDISGADSTPEGSMYELSLGTINDPGDDSVYRWIVNWGDGVEVEYESSGIVQHTFQDGDSAYDISVSLADEDGLHENAGSKDILVDNISPVVSIVGPDIIDEGSIYLLTLGTIDDPGDDTTTEVTVDWGDGIIEIYPIGAVISHVYEDGNAFVTIYISLQDEDGLHTNAGSKNVAIRNVAPTISPINTHVDPTSVNSAVQFDSSFRDPGILDTHSAIWDWGDGKQCNTQVNLECTLDEFEGSGLISGVHNYTSPGLYKVSLKTYDNDGAFDEEYYQYVVIYDVEGGFLTGGGWFYSEVGYCKLDPLCETASGKASFSMNSKYHKNAEFPKGQTQFNFHLGNMDFHSSSYQWMVVFTAKGVIRGTGSINQQPGYGFIMSVVDGDKLNANDAIRMKIWSLATGQVVYDSMPGSDILADPATILGGGNITIH